MAEKRDDPEKQVERQTFENKQVRKKFVRQVYLILFSQLFFTSAIVCLFVLAKPIKDLFCQVKIKDKYGALFCGTLTTAGKVLYIFSFVLFFTFYFVIVCFQKLRRTWPINIFVLLGLTLCLSFLVHLNYI